MDKQTKQQEILQRLHNLADQPSTQARYALELLDQERGNQVVSAALDIVTAADTPEARPVSSSTRAAICAVRSWEHYCLSRTLPTGRWPSRRQRPTSFVPPQTR